VRNARVAASGAFGRKPYADDPLIRSLNAVWGDREKARIVNDAREPQPETPEAPPGDLVGTSPQFTGR
jgi:hypothetical protein